MNDLKEYYNKLYTDGKEKYWNDLKDSKDGLGKSHHFIIDDLAGRKFKPMSMLDFGCGEGDFLEYFHGLAKRVGIDFSEVAIAHAKARGSKVTYVLGAEEAVKGTYDFITSVGVLEHVEHPQKTFRCLYKALNQGGLMYLVCPSHYNIRGVIWQALNVLLNVPMSLADRHVISLADIKAWVGRDAAQVNFGTIDPDVVMGDDMIRDLNKRLTNALLDAKLDNTKVPEFLTWLKEAKHHFTVNGDNGCEAVYVIKKSEVT